jgi:hypothetical protein
MALPDRSFPQNSSSLHAIVGMTAIYGAPHEFNGPFHCLLRSSVCNRDLAISLCARQYSDCFRRRIVEKCGRRNHATFTESTGVKVVASYAASPTLIKQIEQGAWIAGQIRR